MLAVSYSKLLLEKCFRVQPRAQKALFVQEALTGCTSPINSVTLTRIIPSRHDLRSARPSKNDLSAPPITSLRVTGIALSRSDVRSFW